MSTPHCPEDWPHYQWFRLARRGLPVDAEVPASQPDRRAWVRVDPLGDARYRVSYFEVDRHRYQEVFETWDYDEPGLVLSEQRLVVTGEPELKRALSQWLDDLTRLRDPGVGTSRTTATMCRLLRYALAPRQGFGLSWRAGWAPDGLLRRIAPRFRRAEGCVRASR